MRIATRTLLGLLLLAATLPALAQPTLVTIIAAEGEGFPGTDIVIDNLNVPFYDGALGFTGSSVDTVSTETDNFVGCNGVPVWANSATGGTPALSGAETVMGIGIGCTFIYSPSIDGDDGVWTDEGFLAVENTQAPGFGTDTLSTFHSRPTMIPPGVAFWVAGFNDGTLSTTTVGRALYTSPDRTPASIAIVLRAGDLVDGLAIDEGSGVGFDYDFSDDGANHIHDLLMDTGSTTDDGALYVNGTLVARESSPVIPLGEGTENWDNFDDMMINTSGVYAFSGDTDGSTSTDEFIAVGGLTPTGDGGGSAPVIALREGDVVGGVTLGTTAQGLALINTNFLAWAWTTDVGTTDEAIFVGEVADLSGTSTLVLRTGDQIDTDGDLLADHTVTDLNTFANSIALSPEGMLYLDLDLTPIEEGGVEFEAIVALDVSDLIPVELVSFSGVADGDAALLSWTTSSETNNAGFEVQVRGESGFEALGFVDGHGTTTEAHTYSFRAPGLDAGTHTFRLKQIDFDGAFEYSAEVEVEIGLPERYHLSDAYPNPFNPSTQFSLTVAETQDVTVAVYDALGRRVMLLHDGELVGGTAHAFTLDAARLASGAYVIRVSGDGFSDARAITLLK